MRINPTKITSLNLITLFFLAFSLISDGFARRLANDHSESQSSKNARNSKLALSAPPSKRVPSKPSAKRVNLRNTKDRKIPANRQRQIKGGKLNYPIGVYGLAGAATSAPMGATSTAPVRRIANTPVPVTRNSSLNGVFIPSAYTFFKCQGDIQRLTPTAVIFKNKGQIIQVKSNYILYSQIPVGQRNRLWHITGKRLLPRQIVNYGFFPYPSRTSLSTFMSLVLKKKATDTYYVGYLSPNF